MLRRSLFSSLLCASLALAACGDDISDDDPINPGADAGMEPDGGEPDAGGPLADDDEPVSGATVEQCDAELPAPTEGACTVTAGLTAGQVMIQGDVLVGDTVYANGAVVYQDDTIVCTGCDCAGDAAYAEATRVACPGAAVSAGLINAHDHITFNEGSPIDHGDTRYDHRHEWRAVLDAPGNAHGGGATSSGTQWGELRHTLAGATSLFGSGGAAGGLRNLDRPDAAEEAQGFVALENDTFSLGDADPETQMPADCAWDYRRAELEVSFENAYLPHVAEGIDAYAAEEFRCQSQSIQGGRDFTEANTSHIHSIALDAGDYWNMARDSARLIWSPRSNISLYGFTAGVQIFDALGGVVALGTDWSYSGSANVLRELACADYYNDRHLGDHFTDLQLWQMATINAAEATGVAEVTGSLEVGKVPDIAVFATEGAAQHRAVLEADNGSVVLVVQGGEVMTGKRAVVDALTDGCEVIDVCGSEHAVCAEREYGTTFEAIATDVAEGDRPAYPAIFCGVPEGEPSCVPARPDEFSGVPVVGDVDGDGIADGDDSCPEVFNPIRPIDDGAQPDSDGDGSGDACDDEPLNPDLDGDSVANLEDVCPFHEDPDQADADEDTKGDVCDACDELANAEGVCPPPPEAETTIEAIQTEQHAIDDLVVVRSVVVTAVYDFGFWVQDPTGGSTFAGVYVYAGDGHGVARGDLVDVIGTYTEYFDDTEIEAIAVTVVGSGTPIVPQVLSADQAAQEEYEGMLVTIPTGTVTANPYDCSNDVGSCNDDGLYEIDGAVLVYDRTYEDADWADHMGDVPVTGVMSYRFNRRRIQPRTAADFSVAP